MRKAITASLFTFYVSLGFSQSVGIGTGLPDSSAQLDVVSTNKGFLPPRVALQAVNIASPVTRPAAGLLVYNTDSAGTSPNNVLPGYYYWSGAAWSKLSNDNSHQLPGGATIKNFNESLATNATRTFIIPPGKVWKINYWAGGSIRTVGNAFFAYMGGDLSRYDLLLNQNDSFAMTGSFFLSITEYPATAKAVKTFDDVVAGNATNTYTVPPGKIWKINFYASIGGVNASVGNPSIQISLPSVSENVIATDMYLAPNTTIRLTNPDTGALRYFLSIAEFDE